MRSKSESTLSKAVWAVYYWLPPVIVMSVIFFLSSRHRFAITEKYWSDFLIFKSLHMIEYGLLFFLIFRAIYKTTHTALRHQFVTSFLIAFLYAVSDELHQTFVPTRSGTIRDIVIDTAGISIVYLFLKRYLDFIKKYF